MSTWPDLLPEDPNERAIFDDNAELHGSPLMAVWAQLNAASVMAPKQGSWGRYLAVIANEVRAAMIAQADLAAARAEGAEAMRAACAGIAQGWLAQHGATNPEHISAQVWACDAVTDIIDGIRAIPAADALARRDDGVIAEIAAERRRQVEVEGWTPAHDDTHASGEMAGAAACYASFSCTADRQEAIMDGDAPLDWPWARRWWKPSDPRRDLVKAAALIVAEIERLDRAAIRARAVGEERQG